MRSVEDGGDHFGGAVVAVDGLGDRFWDSVTVVPVVVDDSFEVVGGGGVLDPGLAVFVPPVGGVVVVAVRWPRRFCLDGEGVVDGRVVDAGPCLDLVNASEDVGEVGGQARIRDRPG